MTLPSYDGPSGADQIGFAIDPRGCRPELITMAPPEQNVTAPEGPSSIARGGSPESLNRAESPAPEGPTINVPSKSTATKTVEERRREVA